MTTILGISAFYHDSAAALIKDGNIVSAAQEERFSRKKHDSRYPYNAINFILEESIPTDYEFLASDLNEDERIDVLDVIALVNIILQN